MAKEKADAVGCAEVDDDKEKVKGVVAGCFLFLAAKGLVTADDDVVVVATLKVPGEGEKSNVAAVLELKANGANPLFANGRSIVVWPSFFASSGLGVCSSLGGALLL